MDYRNTEKALMQITFEVLADLSIANSIKKRKQGFLYSAYRESDNSLKIGYTEFLDHQLKYLERIGYSLNKARKGSPKEKLYLKQTLKELGCRQYESIDNYLLTKELETYLRQLDWPIY